MKLIETPRKNVYPKRFVWLAYSYPYKRVDTIMFSFGKKVWELKFR
jgi:hypothetical protein